MGCGLKRTKTTNLHENLSAKCCTKDAMFSIIYFQVRMKIQLDQYIRNRGPDRNSKRVIGLANRTKRKATPILKTTTRYTSRR